MTIQLTTACFINGSLAASGSQHTLDEATEAGFIYQGMATRVGSAPDQGGAYEIAYLNASGAVVDIAGVVLIRPVVSYAWADRPAATLNSGVVIRITDIGGTAGSRWISDGTYWKPESGRVLLGSTGLGASIAGTSAAETILGSVVVPAGCMGTNGELSIVTTWSTTSSANTKTIRVRFGNADLTGDQIWNSPQTTIGGIRGWTEVQNRNNTSSQVCGTAQNNSILGGGTPPAIFTTAKNTLLTQNIVITGQRDAASAAASETMTLERYMIELIVP